MPTAMKANSDITIMLGRHGVSSYSLWRVRGPLGSDIAWMECFAIGIDGKGRILVETREDGTWTVFQPSHHRRPEATAASIAMVLNAEAPPAGTYPARPGEHEPHPRENAGGVDVWKGRTASNPPADDTNGEAPYRK